MTTPSTDSLKAAPATRPVEIDLAEAPLSAPKITLGQGLPEGMQRILAAVLLIPAACMLSLRTAFQTVGGLPESGADEARHGRPFESA